MEGVGKMKRIVAILLFTLLFGLSIQAKEQAVRVVYYKNLFGHIHKNASRYSQSLSTIGCGHPIKILGYKGKEIVTGTFNLVKVGPYKGYIDKKYLVSKKPSCFQDKYPRFFDNIGLSLTDMYYWGKLYDQYIYGRSTVQ